MKSILRVLLLLQFGALDEPPMKNRQWVKFQPEEQIVQAGKRSFLSLSFSVDPGVHVNSHHPAGDLEIATEIEMRRESGVSLEEAQFPEGKSYKTALNAGETLNVYTDNFVVRVPVTAVAGQHELSGTLTYQACDKAACYPPRHLPFSLPFVSR